MATPKVLLFDLGGVLVDSSGLRELPALLPAPMRPEDLRRKWVSSAAVEAIRDGTLHQGRVRRGIHPRVGPAPRTRGFRHPLPIVGDRAFPRDGGLALCVAEQVHPGVPQQHECRALGEAAAHGRSAARARTPLRLAPAWRHEAEPGGLCPRRARACVRARRDRLLRRRPGEHRRCRKRRAFGASDLGPGSPAPRPRRPRLVVAAAGMRIAWRPQMRDDPAEVPEVTATRFAPT